MGPGALVGVASRDGTRLADAPDVRAARLSAPVADVGRCPSPLADTGRGSPVVVVVLGGLW